MQKVKYSHGIFNVGKLRPTNTNVPPPKDAKSPTPILGVRWRCHGCSTYYPAWMTTKGVLGHSPACHDDFCPACEGNRVAFDPAKGTPKINKGEFAIAWQFKRFDLNGGLIVGEYTVTGRARIISDTLNRYKVDNDSAEDPLLEIEYPEHGRIVKDRESYERVLRDIDGFARRYLRVTDHDGAACKIEDLQRVFPYVPAKRAEAKTIDDFVIHGTQTKAEERAACLRTLCKGFDVDIAPDGMSAVVKRAVNAEAFAKRKEQLRKAGAPFEPSTRYHGTCAHNIPSILKHGLRQSPAAGRAFGAGIYCGEKEKALGFAHCCSVEHFGPKVQEKTYDGIYVVRNHQSIDVELTRVEKRRLKILPMLHIAVELDVLLGRVYETLATLGPNDEAPRRALGRGDSIYMSGFASDEWVVYRTDQVMVRRVVILGEELKYEEK